MDGEEVSFSKERWFYSLKKNDDRSFKILPCIVEKAIEKQWNRAE